MAFSFYVTNLMTTILLCHRLKDNEKALRETQTLRAKTEPKNFAPSQPLPGGAGQPEFNQLEMVTTFTYKLSLVRIDARNFELSW